MKASDLLPRTPASRAAILAILASGGIGFGIARLTMNASTPSTAPGNKAVLYWYDPMVPNQHFGEPGKSPFMDMQLVPKYAGEGTTSPGAATPGVSIDGSQSQALGMRLATAERGTLSSTITATGTIDFNGRDVAMIQPRSGGFVQRVYARAPGDIIPAGAPIADLLVPDWGGAQSEYLAVRRSGDAALTAAARQRLQLLGMPGGLIETVSRTGKVRNVVTITTPIGGAIKMLGVRAGMTVTPGQTLAEVDGLSTVWLNAAVPEAVAGRLRIGAPVKAALAAFPDDRFSGRIAAILPQTDTASRTLTVRIELPNRDGRLRPGMFATVTLGDGDRSALLVPSEAVIRTGTRSIVMLSEAGGRFHPAEVRPGSEANGRTEILAGLSEGEKVVASGQFLVDSEASLSGIAARPVASTMQTASSAQIYETTGRIETLDRSSVTLSHQPVPALGWPAMTMAFRLVDPAIARGFKPGDQVHFAFDQPSEGPTLRSMARESRR